MKEIKDCVANGNKWKDKLHLMSLSSNKKRRNINFFITVLSYVLHVKFQRIEWIFIDDHT